MLIYQNERKHNNHPTRGLYMYKCECSFCGNIVFVRKGYIKTQKSCGCQKSRDVTNQKIKHITYDGTFIIDSHRCKRHRGICVCGKEVYTLTSNLNKRISCGCLSWTKNERKDSTIYGTYFPLAYLKMIKH